MSRHTLKEKECIQAVWRFYKREGRHSLPWRHTTRPYHILVSEIMLQQTQVDRVIPKYKNFLKRFPSLLSLSEASLGEVLREWQGLGYNRRAKMLHLCAKQIRKTRYGVFPKTHSELITLPGIGHYTGGALMAFAWNMPVPIIETNIRSVIIHHFFTDNIDVPDRAVMEYVEKIMDTKNPREWYYALMDYGAYLKKTIGNPNTRSKKHVIQKAFKGSDREIRGAIVRVLTNQSLSRIGIHALLKFDVARIDVQLGRLTEEGMLQRVKNRYRLPNV